MPNASQQRSPLASQCQAVWAVGRNYGEHAKELGNDIPNSPLIFLKAPRCIVTDETIHLPKFSTSIHHEVEIALRLGNPKSPLATSVTHMTLGLDLTARDIQQDAKKKGEPWTLAKSFAQSLPLGSWVEFCGWEKFRSLEFSLEVNGAERQRGFSKDMIFEPQNIIAYLRERFPVAEGDILLTGTPSGVGPLCRGDQARGHLKGYGDFLWTFS